jgi:hypothetical protein
LNNAEITREMVEATNESGQAKNESRLLRDKLKKAQVEAQKLQTGMDQKELELEEVKNEQFTVLHKNKSDFMQMQEQRQYDLNMVSKERDSLEARLKQVLMEADAQLQEI